MLKDTISCVTVTHVLLAQQGLEVVADVVVDDDTKVRKNYSGHVLCLLPALFAFRIPW